MCIRDSPSVMLTDKFVLGEVRGENNCMVAYCCGVQIYVERAVSSEFRNRFTSQVTAAVVVTDVLCKQTYGKSAVVCTRFPTDRGAKERWQVVLMTQI